MARLIQGLSGASLVPLSQVLLLDINPPEKHGPAIAAFGMGTLLGPMLGPILGGWLTEYVSWRAIFLINAPVGVLAFFGLMVFARNAQPSRASPFDARGFAFVSITLGAFQLMLDRGQMLDWLESTEICIEATIAALFAYISVVHMLTARDPFIKPAIFKDRNFLLGTLLSAVTGIFLNGVVPIMTSMMQQLMGYPVLLTGLISIPRALGNLVTIVFVGRLVTVVDPRYLIFLGMTLLAGSLVVLSSTSLETSQGSMALVTFLQGLGSGLLFLPLTLIVFSTLPQQYRNEGSTLFTLVRSLAGAAGISIIQAATLRDQAQVQSRLVERVRPDNPIVAWRLPDFDLTDMTGMQALMGQIGRQASMVAYVNSFHAILALAIVAAPLPLLMRRASRSKGPLPLHHGE